MGGDNAPQAIIEGAVEAAGEKSTEREIILVGKEKEIKEELAKYNLKGLQIDILKAAEVVEMDEKSPVNAVRARKDSSISRTVDLLKEQKVDAVVSAGNTGAVVAATKLKLRTLEGIERPAIAIHFPNPVTGSSVVLDGGANMDCKPIHLVQFGVMGSVYAEYLLGMQNPRIGLMNIGEEASKGNDLTKEGYKLLEQTKLNFIGNVEGRDVFEGTVDVLVCDGFVGNVILKVSESLGIAIWKFLKDEIRNNLLMKLAASILKPAFRGLRKRCDYAEYGGAPLLGINGICIICHGSSPPKAITSAIKVAEEFAELKVNQRIVDEIKKNRVVQKNQISKEGELIEASTE